MKLQKLRWSRVYESAEEELVNFLHDRNIDAERIAAEEFDKSEPQIPEQDTTLWCAEGSLTVRAVDNVTFSVQPGDALRIPAFTTYEMNAGMSGYVIYKS